MSGWDNAMTGKPGTGAVNSHSFGGAVSFFRTPFARDLSGIDVAVMGIPLDIAVTNRSGARLGRARSVTPPCRWPGSVPGRGKPIHYWR
jgi:agmatinase